MGTSFEHRNPRPRLVVESRGGSALRNCYSASYQRITSTQRMSKAQIEALRTAGVLSCGQEFYIRSQCDGAEAPAGMDEVPCSVVVDGVVDVNKIAINEYSGKPYAPIKQPYFVYDTESRVDSGD